jgi:hypothetical protein
MISRRSLEIVTAVLTGTFGMAVAISSIDNEISWTTAGVGAGTFPFMTGLIILTGSAVNLMFGWRGDRSMVLAGQELNRLYRLFVPAALYIAAIPAIGMYVASAVYVWGTISMQGSWSKSRAVGFALLFTLSLYLIFERAFQVSLPHGALGAAFGW